MGKTNIQWTERTWNPVVGCTRVSAGCDHCYAFDFHDRRMYAPYIKAKRAGKELKVPPQFHKPFSQVQCLGDRLDLPKHWRKPSRVFVNSMSDLFHEQVPGEFINRVWMTMYNTKQHTYQILTKRPERLLEWTHQKARACGWPVKEIWPSWIWLGVSVENQEAADKRIPTLIDTPAAVRFLSCEPLLGPVDLYQWLVAEGDSKFAEWNLAMYGFSQPLSWVIVGGESGPKARPMEPEWAKEILEQCQIARVPAFMKQMGAVWAKAHKSANSHGSIMEEWPTEYLVRQYPSEDDYE